MNSHDSRLHNADVVAAFENQDDADEAVLQLRATGFHDNQIGYFAWQLNGSLMDLLDRHYGFAGSVIGGIAGALLGVGAAPLLDEWSIRVMDLHDPLGLAITLGTFGALFVGFIGWWIGASMMRRGVEAPAVVPTAGSFVVAVSAGDARELAWAAIRQHGGHELPPGAMMAHPSAV